MVGVTTVVLALTLSFVQWMIAQWAGNAMPYLGQLQGMLFFFAIWACLAPLVIKFAARLPISGTRAMHHLAIHLLASLVSALVVIAIYTRIQLSGATFPQAFSRMVSGYLDSVMLFYWGLVLIQTTLLARDRAHCVSMDHEQTKRKLAQAELDALHGRLQPHFLFNTLQSLKGMVRSGHQSIAMSTITLLGDWLRRSLDATQNPFTTLSDEIQAAKQYLALIQARFAARLVYEIEVAPSLVATPIMKFTLQPLLENCVKHGVEATSRRTLIQIHVKDIDEQRIHLEVLNRSESASTPMKQRAGLGLENLKARLQMCYLEPIEWDDRRIEHGYAVAITLPRQVNHANPDPHR